MSSYKDLVKQREALEKQIQDARKNELAEAVRQVRILVGEYGLTAFDVFPSQRSTKGSKVVAKYKNPETGETWTGRGKEPKWIKDQDRENFVI